MEYWHPPVAVRYSRGQTVVLMKVLAVGWGVEKVGTVDADNQSKPQLLSLESLVVMGVLQDCCH